MTDSSSHIPTPDEIQHQIDVEIEADLLNPPLCAMAQWEEWENNRR